MVQNVTMQSAFFYPDDEVAILWAADDRYCMSVDGNTFKNGAKMQLWECSGSMGQVFLMPSYPLSLPQFLLKPSDASGFCVVIDGNQNRNGARAQLWQCDPSVFAQHWFWECGSTDAWGACDYMLLKNAAFPDKCLVVNGNTGHNGNFLQLWSCADIPREARLQGWLLPSMLSGYRKRGAP